MNMNRRSRITINKYNEYIDTTKFISPRRPVYITADSYTVPVDNYRVLSIFPIKTNIYIQFEPNVIFPAREFILQNWRLFKYIITYDDVILSKLPNAVKYIYSTTWLKQQDYNYTDTSLKKFKISVLVGFKAFTPGHKLRHELYQKQREFSLTIYRSNLGTQLGEILNNPLLPDNNKINLFKEFQFSVVIENSQQTNYFTEKLIDCLITKTIPIYWGCPNISEYFDTTGWIIFNDIDDLKQKLSVLDESYYGRYTEVINKNYGIAKLYTDIHTNINRAIQTIPGW